MHYSVVPYKTTPNPDHTPITNQKNPDHTPITNQKNLDHTPIANQKNPNHTQTTNPQNPDHTPTTNPRNPDQALVKNLNNPDDDETLLARLVHEADITEEFNLDDSLQLDQINLDELLDTRTNLHMDIDLLTTDNQRTDTDNTVDFNTHAQTNSKATEKEKHHATLTSINSNMDTLNNDELTDNTSLEIQASKTKHTDQQKPCTSNTNHLDTDNNYVAHPNLTPHQNTNNCPQTHTNTNKNPDFLNIPPNLITSFKIIYALKLKLNKLQTNLIQLQEHKTAKTLPTGLRMKHKSKLYLDREFSDRWEKTLTEASRTLLDITIDHHKQCINDTRYKLQHRIQQLKLKCNEETALQIIEKTDSLFLKYTKRALINAQIKPTKRIKRVHETQPKHNKHTMTTQKQPGYTTPTTTQRNSNRIVPPNSTDQSTTQLYTPPSRHTHTPQHTSIHTQTRSMDSCQPHVYNTEYTTSTSTPTTQQTALTPLMQIHATHQMVRLNTSLSTPTQIPKLRIPPRSQKHRTPLLHNITSQQNRFTTQPHLPTTHRTNTPSNRPTNNIPLQVTQDIQSQIQNFLTYQANKHHK